jgi:uncharacterized lipoprotein YmbA
MRAKTLSMLALVLVGACSTPQDHFYTLIADLPSAQPVAGSSTGLSVRIAAITLPEAVDRAELVVRKGPNSVAVHDARRWAESLKSAIPRVLANDLSPLLDGAAVSTADDNVGQHPKYQVKLDITRFDTTLGGTEAIDVAWVIHRDGGKADITGKAALRVTAHGAEFDDAVAAHTQALGRLSEEIASQIKGLEKSGN